MGDRLAGNLESDEPGFSDGHVAVTALSSGVPAFHQCLLAKKAPVLHHSHG